VRLELQKLGGTGFYQEKLGAFFAHRFFATASFILKVFAAF